MKYAYIIARLRIIEKEIPGEITSQRIREIFNKKYTKK